MEYMIIEEALDHIPDEAKRDELRSKVWHYSRFKEKGVWLFHTGVQLQAELDNAGMVRKAKCGDADVIALNIREMVDTGIKWFDEDPEKWYKQRPEVIKWLTDAKAAAQQP